MDPARWLDRHGDALWRFALARVGSAEEAEDLVQEALLAALGAHERFRDESSERTWITAILRHKIADHVRRQARATREIPADGIWDDLFTRRGRWKSDPGRWPAGPDGDGGPEFWRMLESCLGRLPAPLAETFVLREVRSLAADAVCETLGITPENLWARLHRAREGLRRCLRAALGGKEPR